MILFLLCSIKSNLALLSIWIRCYLAGSYFPVFCWFCANDDLVSDTNLPSTLSNATTSVVLLLLPNCKEFILPSLPLNFASSFSPFLLIPQQTVLLLKRNFTIVAALFFSLDCYPDIICLLHLDFYAFYPYSCYFFQLASSRISIPT